MKNFGLTSLNLSDTFIGFDLLTSFIEALLLLQNNLYTAIAGTKLARPTTTPQDKP